MRNMKNELSDLRLVRSNTNELKLSDEREWMQLGNKSTVRYLIDCEGVRAT